MHSKETSLEFLKNRILELESRLKISENQLQAPEEQALRVFDNMLEGCMLIGFDWTYLYVNEAAARHGYKKREELIGRTIFEMYPDVENTEIFAAYRRCMKQREPQLVESEFIFTDENRNWYSLSIYPVPQGIFVLSRDITNRKHTEQALHESKEKYRIVADNTYDWEYWTAPDGSFLYCSPSCERITGYSPDEFIADPDLHNKIIHPDDTNIFREHKNETKSLNASCDICYRIINRDGSVRWIGHCCQHVFGADGEFLGIRGSNRDITESKHAEEKVRKSEEKYRTLFDESFDGLFITSPQGKILDMNKKGVMMFGYDTKEEMLKLDLARDVYAVPLDRQRILSMVNEQGSAEYDLAVKKKNGETMDTHCSLSAVKDERGEITAYRGIIRDITEQKKAENALRRSEAELKEAQRVGKLGSWDWDSTTDTITWSEEYYRIFGLDPTQPPPGYEEHLKIYTPESASRLDAAVKLSEQTGTPYELDLERDSAYGEKLWITARSEIKRDSNGQIVGLRGTAQDITERKRAEEIMRARINIIEYASVGSLDDLLQKTLDEAELLTGSKIGFFHFMLEDQKTLHLKNWSTNTIKTMCTAEGKDSHYSVDQAGVWVDCVHQRRPVIHNDYASLPHRKGLPPGHAPVIRELVVPVLRDDRISAILGVGNKQTDYNEKDVETVSLLANLVYDIVLRKRAEEALRESEARYRATLFSIGDAVIATDTEGRIEVVNPVAEALTGWTETEAVGKPVDEVFLIYNEETRETAENPIWRVKREGVVVGLANNTVLITKNGDEYPIADSGAPIHAKDGTLTGVVLIFRDQTAERAAQKALRESEGNLNEAQRIAHIGSWELNLINNKLLWSDEIYRIFEIDPNAFGASYEAFLETVHPDDREAVDKAYTESLKNKTPYEIVHRLRMKDGRIKHVLEQCETFYDPAGHPLRSLGTVQDITERKRAEEQNKIERETLEILNQQQDTSGTIRGILHLLKKKLDIEALAIRLRDGDDFPYYETTGFPEDFINAERFLCAYDDNGRIVRDGVGNPVLECMCGNILCGRTDAMLPFFTGGGSFWTNSTTALLASTNEEDRQARTRNRCNGEGYESVALIPLRSGDEIIGLIQLNDNRPNRFTPEMLHFLEGLGTIIGISLSHRLFEETLHNTLVESEERLKTITETARDAIIMIDAQGAISYWNPAAESIFGYSKSEALNRNMHELLAPERYMEAHRRAFPEFIHMGKGDAVGRTLELTGLRKDGREIEIELSLSAIVLKGQWHAVGIIRDITERKRAEEALRESEEKYRLLVSNASEAIFIVQDKSVKFPNPKTLEMTGYSVEELSTIFLTDLITHEDRIATLEEHLNHMKSESAPLAYRFRIKRKDGNELWVELNTTAIIWEEKPGVLCFLRNITEEKKLESQILQAQKMESVGRLAGGVAHDFNNMLGVIIGYADMTLSDIEPKSPIRDSLQEIRNAAKRSADLTRQLLAFARRQTANPKTLDLNDAVSGTIKMLGRLIGENIDLSWNPGHGLWSVRIDPVQINQILANLAVNARDAISDMGKITIETSNTSIDSSYCLDHTECVPGEYVMLSLSDDGTGMNKELLDHIFEPFFTTKESGVGTGLGLSTVYGIVKQNGGFINVYSEPGQGTTFKVYLPRFIAETEASSDSEEHILLRGNGEIVMVVEDEKAILTATTKMLKKLGYNVLPAGSAREALDLAEKHAGSINLLIVDVVMPNTNGWELSQELKTLQPDLKCLFMSGYTANVIAHQGLLKENILFMEKPFSVRDLAENVGKALNRQ